MIRCRRHHHTTTEPGDGVCAFCLRERLQNLIAAQSSPSPPCRRRPHLFPTPPPPKGSSFSVFSSLFGRKQRARPKKEESDGCDLPKIMPSPIRKALPGRAIMGLTVCLSPLVRTNPVSGDPRVSPRQRRPSGGAPPVALCPNRSRKIADFGRFR